MSGGKLLISVLGQTPATANEAWSLLACDKNRIFVSAFLSAGVAMKSQRSPIAKMVRVVLVKEMREAMVNGNEFVNQDFVMVGFSIKSYHCP